MSTCSDERCPFVHQDKPKEEVNIAVPLCLSLIVVMVTLTLGNLWEFFSPFQATVGAGQLTDDNMTYAASRMAANFDVWSILGPVLGLTLLVIWGRVIWKSIKS